MKLAVSYGTERPCGDRWCKGWKKIRIADSQRESPGLFIRQRMIDSERVTSLQWSMTGPSDDDRQRKEIKGRPTAHQKPWRTRSGSRGWFVSGATLSHSISVRLSDSDRQEFENNGSRGSLRNNGRVKEGELRCTDHDQARLRKTEESK